MAAWTATARRKSEVLHECYRSQIGRDWFDHEAFLGLMRLRGVQCHRRYAEAFVVEKAAIELCGARLAKQ